MNLFDVRRWPPFSTHMQEHICLSSTIYCETSNHTNSLKRVVHALWTRHSKTCPQVSSRLPVNKLLDIRGHFRKTAPHFFLGSVTKCWRCFSDCPSPHSLGCKFKQPWGCSGNSSISCNLRLAAALLRECSVWHKQVTAISTHDELVRKPGRSSRPTTHLSIRYTTISTSFRIFVLFYATSSKSLLLLGFKFSFFFNFDFIIFFCLYNALQGLLSTRKILTEGIL